MSLVSAKDYKTWIFDCDGVLLDSNQVKSRAFYDTALPYGANVAERFLSYHKKFGGVSRFEKFRYLFADILGMDHFEPDLQTALLRFSELCKLGLKQSRITPGLVEMLTEIKTQGGQTMIVSGGLQSELREHFSERKLEGLFDQIFGSPDDKETILEREVGNGSIVYPGIFFGDSQYDFETCSKFDLDFVFISAWTEFKDWDEYFSGKAIPAVSFLADCFRKT